MRMTRRLAVFAILSAAPVGVSFANAAANTTTTVVARPTATWNGWGPNAHVGAYEKGVNQGYNWGLDSGTTYPYVSPANATDGNASTFAYSAQQHTHKYSGCVYTFSAVTPSGKTRFLNIDSEVPPSGTDGYIVTKRSAGIWYSMDGGTTWTQVYNVPGRSRQTDSIALGTSRNLSQLVVMAFSDAHDDMYHKVYDISVTEVTSATTTTLTSSPNPSTYGVPVTFTATVLPSAATGVVTFYDGTTSIGSASLSSGTVTLTSSNLTTNSHSIAASYGGDSNYSGSTASAITQIVNKGNVTIALASSATTPSYGTPVAFTATLTPSAATGTVTFSSGSTTLGTSTISSGAATLTTSSLPAGTNSITASYSGDVNFNPVVSAALPQPVSPPNASVTISASASTAVYGTAILFTAKVTPAPVSGTVLFGDGDLSQGGTPLGDEVPIGSNGTAELTTASLSAGAHSISAWYGYKKSTNSAAVTVTKADPTIALTSSPNPSATTQPVRFTATVLLPNAPPTVPGPTGSVNFTDTTAGNNGRPIGSASLDAGGQAAITTSALSDGQHSITATYTGDANFNSRTSDPPVTQVVNPAPHIIGLSLSQGPPQMGVVITGKNFGDGTNNSAVTFNGVHAAVIPGKWSSDGTSITVQVPAGATSGAVVVTVDGHDSNGQPFTVKSIECSAP